MHSYVKHEFNPQIARLSMSQKHDYISVDEILLNATSCCPSVQELWVTRCFVSETLKYI